jgi:hypothetical protein
MSVCVYGISTPIYFRILKKSTYEELHNLYSSPHIIRMMKSKRIRWVGYVARMVRKGAHIRYLWERQKERDHKEDQAVGVWIILKWILDRMVWIGLMWLRIRISGGLL